MTTYTDLLSGTYWHSGGANVSYSFLGTPPDYYPTLDVDGDGIDDARVISGTASAPDEIVAINDDVSLNAAQQAAAQNAITRWNEVANVNLTPVANTGSGSGSTPTGTPVTPGGTLVSGLGGPAGYGEIEAPRNDDGYMLLDSTQVSAVFETGLNFFGTTYDSFYVNTNGSISFGSGISTYTPSTITSGGTPAILPFWADVDTRAYSDGSTPPEIYVDVDPAADVITVTWPGVDYYRTPSEGHDPKANWFQLQLYDRGNGDFDIVYRYQDINWSAGDASGGSQGLGGTAAHAGWTAGNGTNYFELPQSGDEAAILDLENASGNTGVPGFWVFQVRNGEVSIGDVTFAAYDAYSQSGTDDLNPTLPPDGQPQTDLFGFMYFPGTLGAHDAAGDMWVNNNQTYGGRNLVESPTPGDEGWATFLHELGHGLGFTHPGGAGTNSNNQYTVMSYTAHPSEVPIDENASYNDNMVWPVTPLLLDIQAAQSVYGANMNTRTGDDVYFAPGGEFAIEDGGSLIAAVWDAGGNDTFSAENQTFDVTIDLRPGHFSSIGAIDNNIAIAEGVSGSGAMSAWIENAIGGFGDDALQGNILGNVLQGRAGNDVLRGDAGWDLLYGGSGRDELSGGVGQDNIHGGAGNDNLYGQDGNDSLHGEDGWDHMWGGAGDDNMWGGALGDVLVGETGNDLMRGEDGWDLMYGGPGRDTMWGGTGVDDMRGGSGNDLMRGEDGNDFMYGEDGWDTMSGGAGDDAMWGGALGDTMAGDTGNDQMYGEAGNDIMLGGNGLDQMHGGFGADVMHGGAGNDVMYGEIGDDELFGETGMDTLYGGNGIDVLYGGADNDTLVGGTGGDVLDGGVGNDTMWGGYGADVFVFRDGFGRDVIRDFDLGLDKIDLSGVTTITGWSDLNLTIAASGNVSISDGNDSIELTGITSIGQLQTSDFIF